MKRRKAESDEDFPSDLVTMDGAIEIVVDAVLIGNDSLRKMTLKVLKAQRRLHRAVDDDAWKAYLRLEEVINQRVRMQMDVLVSWASRTSLDRVIDVQRR